MTSLAKFLEPNWTWTQVDKWQLPLTSPEVLVAFAIAYLIIITVGTQLMKGRKPYTMHWLTIPYNMIMCVFSGWCFLGSSIVFYENWRDNGFELLLPLCDPQRHMAEGMQFWMYVFYLSKYVEFIDSFVLVLKGKRLIPPESSQFFLHVFHHTTTASIAWVVLFLPVSIGWIGPITNCFVHFFMYGYYGLVELNLIPRAWGGKFITPIQLVQFVVCLLSITYETANVEKCESNHQAITWLVFCYLIFLGFFLRVYFKKAGERQGNRAASAQKKDK